MPSWTDIQEYARKTYTLQNDEAEWFGLVFKTTGERTQLVTVTLSTVGESEEWLHFRSRICKRDELKPEVALKKNHWLATCSISLDADQYWATRFQQLATLDIEEFERILQGVSAVADEIEENATAEDAN